MTTDTQGTQEESVGKIPGDAKQEDTPVCDCNPFLYQTYGKFLKDLASDPSLKKYKNDSAIQRIKNELKKPEKIHNQACRRLGTSFFCVFSSAYLKESTKATLVKNKE